KWKHFSKPMMALAFLIFLFLSFSWVGVMIAIHRHNFIHTFFVDQSIDRIMSDNYDRAPPRHAKGFLGSFNFMSRTIGQGSFPWSLLVVPVLIWRLSNAVKWKKDGRIIPVIWSTAFLIGLFFFKNKQYWYVIPLYPALALLIGNFLSEFLFLSNTNWKTIAAA